MKSPIKKITELIFEAGTSRRIRRTHFQLLGKTEDSVSDHSFRVIIIGYLLAKELNLDADKVLKMCLFHDFCELRTGDQNWVHKKYIKADEDRIIRDQLKDLKFEKEVVGLLKEYRMGISREAVLAKEADILEEIFQLKEYADQGNKEAARWIPHNAKKLKTSLAKSIIKELKNSDIHNWWWKKWE